MLKNDKQYGKEKTYYKWETWYGCVKIICLLRLKIVYVIEKNLYPNVYTLKDCKTDKNKGNYSITNHKFYHRDWKILSSEKRTRGQLKTFFSNNMRRSITDDWTLTQKSLSQIFLDDIDGDVDAEVRLNQLLHDIIRCKSCWWWFRDLKTTERTLWNHRIEVDTESCRE